MNHTTKKYVRLIWEMESLVEDFAVSLLTDLGALGFETLDGKVRDITLHAYFYGEVFHGIVRDLSSLRKQLPGSGKSFSPENLLRSAEARGLC